MKIHAALRGWCVCVHASQLFSEIYTHKLWSATVPLPIVLMRIALHDCVLMRFPSNAIHQNHLIEVWQRSRGKSERREPSTALVGLDKHSVWRGDALPSFNFYELIYCCSVQKITVNSGLWTKPNSLAHVKRILGCTCCFLPATSLSCKQELFERCSPGASVGRTFGF